MGDVVGTGISRTLVDSDGDNITDASTNSLKVKIVDASDIVDIGDVQLLAGANSGNHIIGTVKVQSLDTTPATFDNIYSINQLLETNTNWHRLPDRAGKEVLIQSLSENADNIYLCAYVDELNEVQSVELLPSTTVSMAISNLNLLAYKKVAHTAPASLLITVLA